MHWCTLVNVHATCNCLEAAMHRFGCSQYVIDTARGAVNQAGLDLKNKPASRRKAKRALLENVNNEINENQTDQDTENDDPLFEEEPPIYSGSDNDSSN